MHDTKIQIPVNAPHFLTIRQAAATGILSEYGLRQMEKAGQLPCVYVGKRCLVNFELLVELLEAQSRAAASQSMEV